VIGFSLIFSSTIISIKLLPTTVLHRKHMGELIAGILLLQDFIAIFLSTFLDAENLQQSQRCESESPFSIIADRLFHYTVYSDTTDRSVRSF